MYPNWRFRMKYIPVLLTICSLGLAAFFGVQNHQLSKELSDSRLELALQKDSFAQINTSLRGAFEDDSALAVALGSMKFPPLWKDVQNEKLYSTLSVKDKVYVLSNWIHENINAYHDLCDKLETLHSDQRNQIDRLASSEEKLLKYTISLEDENKSLKSNIQQIQSGNQTEIVSVLKNINSNLEENQRLARNAQDPSNILLKKALEDNPYSSIQNAYTAPPSSSYLKDYNYYDSTSKVHNYTIMDDRGTSNATVIDNSP